jgi:hypothetical protein
LQDLWSVLAEGMRDSHTGKRRRKGGIDACVWTKQIGHVLRWIKAFLDGQAGAIQRIYSLDSYLGWGAQVLITTDASPWGLGGTLEIYGVVIAYFAERLLPQDASMFGAEIGDCKGQQTWEALALLIALRIWAIHWKSSRVRLVVRGDSMSALHMLLNLKSRGKGSGMIARELALDIADATYYPDIICHAPGLTLVQVDELSRKYMTKSSTWTLPSSLRDAEETLVPPRDATFYRAISPPT